MFFLMQWQTSWSSSWGPFLLTHCRQVLLKAFTMQRTLALMGCICNANQTLFYCLTKFSHIFLGSISFAQIPLLSFPKSRIYYKEAVFVSILYLFILYYLILYIINIFILFLFYQRKADSSTRAVILYMSRRMKSHNQSWAVCSHTNWIHRLLFQESLHHTWLHWQDEGNTKGKNSKGQEGEKEKK